MKDTLYLVATERTVVKMTKSPVSLERGQVICKLNIEIPPSAFRPPLVERTVVIEDWRDGTELADVHLNRDIITEAEAEAEAIVTRRLAKMAEILEARGYEVRLREPAEREGGEPA